MIKDLYQLMPPLGEEEYQSLKADIALRGVMVPIEKDEHGNVLDGHHRLQICEELGISDYPVLIRAGMSEDQKKVHVLSLNLNRRHLSGEQRATVHLTMRQLGMSLRQIAEASGVGVGTVHRDLESTVPFGTVDLPERIVGKDGKSRPATVFAKSAGDADKVFDLFEKTNLIESPHVESILSAAVNASPAALEKATRVLTGQTTNIHVSDDSYEWYTPVDFLESVREVMGGIDLDPATSPQAQTTVGAARIFTKADNGLSQSWEGRVFLNPPYDAENVERFSRKLLESVGNGVSQAVLLVNNSTDTRWFQDCLKRASAVCFPKGRLSFWNPNTDTLAARQGQCFFYFGKNQTEFIRVFARHGVVLLPFCVEGSE